MQNRKGKSMQQFNKKDIITYQGKDFDVREGSGERNFILFNHRVMYMEDINLDEVVLKEKYQAKMLYAGAEATVLACVKDSDNIVYLELVGHEDMVKSITSVIMQGRIKMNEHYLSYTEGYFNVHRGGTRRMLRQMENGYAHAICYHSPSVSDTNFSCLLGSDDDDILGSFKTWLNQTNPLPYPPELVEDLLGNLALKGNVEELDCYGPIKGIKMDKHLGDNEYEAFQEIILETAWEKVVANRYVPPIVEETKQKATLPKSPLLYPHQVQAIYDKLAIMPKTYELDAISPKPVGVKLFNSSMTAYVVEADKGGVDDEREGLQTQTFGYFYNEGYQEGEWGYINVDELIECGFEMDLFFENQYIDDGGNIVEKAAA
jgi:hypothetical protein